MGKLRSGLGHNGENNHLKTVRYARTKSFGFSFEMVGSRKRDAVCMSSYRKASY